MFMSDSRHAAVQMIRSPLCPIAGPSMRKSLAFILLMALAACTPQPKVQPPAAPVSSFPADFPTGFYTAAQAGAVYRVVPGRSSLILKVYKAGAFAALGHNHVITSNAVDGFIYLADDMAAARADLFIPVAALTVDDTAARTAAGPDFATQPTQQDIEGTRTNMLGPKVLDAERFPFVTAHITPLHVRPESTDVEFALTVRGNTARIPIVVTWQRKGDELQVEATFKTDHATLSLEPFSALGGALRVAEPIDIAVALTARRNTVKSAENAPDS
jgi:polyisoprenoid-binding protein YceI